jgi:hypothetical protein
MNISREELFWRHVKNAGPDDCWEWQAVKNEHGYGLYTSDRKTRRAQAVAYAMTYESFEDGLCVLHRCDNPPCCNPVHLFLGTRADNYQDMKQKGRVSATYSTQGRVRKSNWKLTNEQVKEIQRQGKEGIHPLAVEFGVTIQAIRYQLKKAGVLSNHG